MKIELKKWSIEDKESLIRICNTIDRNYLLQILLERYAYSEIGGTFILI